MNNNENLKLKSYYNNLIDFFEYFYVYNDVFINMSIIFRQQLIDGYVKKKSVNRINDHIHRFEKKNQFKKDFLTNRFEKNFSTNRAEKNFSTNRVKKIFLIKIESHLQSTTNNYSSSIQ